MHKFLIWIKDAGMTQEQVARDLGVTQGSVSRWCSGEAIPRYEVMAKIIEMTKGFVMPNDFFATNNMGNQ